MLLATTKPKPTLDDMQRLARMMRSVDDTAKKNLAPLFDESEQYFEGLVQRFKAEARRILLDVHPDRVPMKLRNELNEWAVRYGIRGGDEPRATRHVIKCTDGEEEILAAAAKRAGVSVVRFMLTAALNAATARPHQKAS